MMYIRGEAREQGRWTNSFVRTHICRVIEAFVGRLDMAQLGFVREEPTKTRLRWRCPAIFGEQQSKTNKRCPAFPNIAFSYLLPARFVTGCAGSGPYTRTTRIYFLGAMASLADLAR